MTEPAAHSRDPGLASLVFVAVASGPEGEQVAAITLTEDGTEEVIVDARIDPLVVARGQLERLSMGRVVVVYDAIERRALGIDRAEESIAPAAPGAREAVIDPVQIAELALFLHLVVPEPGDSRRAQWERRFDLPRSDLSGSSLSASAHSAMEPAAAPVALARARGLADLLRAARLALAREGEDAIEALRRGLDTAGAVERVLLDGLSAGEVRELRRGDSALGPARGAAVERAPAVQDGEVLAAFAETGPVARATRAYRRREAQVSYSRAVASAIRRGDVLMVEAGTGVGKSFGYLVPLLLHAHRSERPVVVATRTKNLQAQLYHRDVPALIAAMDLPVRVAMVKGRGDYLCMKRLRDRVEAAEQDGDADERLAVAWFDRFARRSADGDLERVPPWILERLPSASHVLAGVRCEHGSSGRRCSFGAACFYPRIAARARSAHLLIANHALVLRWPRAYPVADVLVLDEAHDLVDGATSAFSRSVGDGGLRAALRRVVGHRSSGGLLAFVRRAARLGEHLPAGVRELVEDSVEEALRLGARLPHVSMQVIAFALSNPASSGFDASGARRDVLSLDPDVRASRGFSEVTDVLGAFGAALRRLQKTLLEVVARLTMEPQRVVESRPSRAVADRVGGPRGSWTGAASGAGNRHAVEPQEPTDHQLRLEVAAVASALQTAWTTLTEVLRGADGTVEWIEVVRPVRSRRVWFLRVATLDVGETLHARVLDAHRAVVLTSATLRVGGSFDFHAGHLGMDHVAPARRSDPIAFGSPYDYRSALRFFVPLGDQARLSPDSEVASLAIARILLSISLALGGRTLALFHSRARMTRTAERVRPILAREGVIALCPGPDGPPARVLERFRAEERAVLLGSRAFFEGIDVPGKKILCALIDRIPFETPDEPVHRARTRALNHIGESGFGSYSLPRAILRLRQAAGRVVRGEDDRGSVVLLDPRVATSGSYGARVRGALPSECRIGPEAEIMRELLDRHAADLADPWTAASRWSLASAWEPAFVASDSRGLGRDANEQARARVVRWMESVDRELAGSPPEPDSEIQIT